MQPQRVRREREYLSWDFERYVNCFQKNPCHAILCRRDFNYALHLRHYNLFSVFAVSSAIEIRATVQRRQYRSDGCACRFARNARCAGMSIIGNVCFPIERLSEPNDAFRTRVRAHTYNVWTVRATAGGQGRSHCVPLILRCTLDKLANDRHLRKMHFVPLTSRSALCKHFIRFARETTNSTRKDFDRLTNISTEHTFISMYLISTLQDARKGRGQTY